MPGKRRESPEERTRRRRREDRQREKARIPVAERLQAAMAERQRLEYLLLRYDGTEIGTRRRREGVTNVPMRLLVAEELIAAKDDEAKVLAELRELLRSEDLRRFRR